MKKITSLPISSKFIAFFIIVFLLTIPSFAQDTLHLNYIALQTKMPDSTDAKVAEWAKKLNGKHVDVEVLCYYSQSSFKPYATERSDEVFLVLNRKARSLITIVKNEVVKGSKSQRSLVDVVYRTTGSADIVKEKSVQEKKQEKNTEKEANVTAKTKDKDKNEDVKTATENTAAPKKEKEKKVVESKVKKEDEKESDKAKTKKETVVAKVEVKDFKGQNIDVEWSDIDPLKYEKIIRLNSAQTSQNIYFIENAEKDPYSFTLYSFAKQGLTNEKTNTLSIEKESDANLYFKNIISIGGKVFLFYGTNNVSAKKLSLYAVPITESLNMEGKVTIDEINYADVKATGGFRFLLSEDDDKLVILKNIPSEATNNFRINYNVIDKDLKSAYKDVVVLPYKILNEKKKSYGSTIDLVSKFKNDILYLLGNGLVEENDNGKDPLYKEVIITYNLKTNKLSTLNIDVNGIGFHDLNFYFNRKNQLVLVGLTSPGKIKDNRYYLSGIGEAITNGAFVWTLNNEADAVEKKSFRDFNDKYLNYSIYDINEFEDGSIAFACRKFMILHHTYKNHQNILKPKTLLFAEGANMKETIYKYKNVFVFNINTEDANYWKTTFEVDQESQEDKKYFGMEIGNTKDNDGFYVHSIVTLNTNKNLNILINNRTKNEVIIKENENTDLGHLKDQDASTRVISINSKGTITPFTLTDKFGKVNPVLLTNDNAIVLSNNKIISRFITDNGSGSFKVAVITAK